ncbi:beta strand repeat-containing protein [Sphingobium sp. Z007]|uniref:beta strand repeat-containing protein n=1 Tax=Sphingobium sp. Z007 TaxID=627495 RepID=UPI0015960C19|nr:calcium-binding protein [Sphingobium sp. Z007]
MATINGTSGNDTLTGTTGADVINGYAGDDIIDGGSGNDIIDAGSGADIVSGGAGDDLFKMSSISTGLPNATYDGGSGFDTLDYSNSASYIYWSFDTRTGLYNVWDVDFRRVEKLIGGSGQDIFNFYTISDGLTIYGGGGADDIHGGYGDDIIYGGTGDDDLSAGQGYNRIYGEAGDDYISATSGGGIIDGGSGNDTVEAYGTTDLNLGRADGYWGTHELSNIENIVFATVSQSVGIGNDVANRISISSIFETYSAAMFEGRGGDDFLQGGALADQLDGGEGNDELVGKKGNDSLIGGAGNDILDGGEGDDLLQAGSGDDILYGDTGVDTVSYQNFRAHGVKIDLSTGTAYGSEAGSDTLDAIENAIGSDAGDEIIGNGFANRLDGRAGNDLLSGGSGADILDGGTGADRMVGGLGNDIFYIDNVGDVLVEGANGGSDHAYTSASYSLSGIQVETLTLTGSQNINGTGNSLVQTINGNSGHNILSGLGGDDVLNGGDGNDTLIGGTGADRMVGGLGNDIFYVDNLGDVVVEGTNGGTDLVYATVSYSLSGIQAETLTLTGSQNINGTGDSLVQTINGNDGNNILSGLGGNDILNGGDGNDTLIGGTDTDRMVGGNGNDIFYVDNVGDIVVEGANGGTDLVYSTVSYSLSGIQVETLTLTGSQNINGTGNSLAQTINGNSGINTLSGLGGDDRLAGGLGADTLIGGTGSDQFLFASQLGATNIDRISDFTVGVDKILIDNSIFAGLIDGPLSASAFQTGSQAGDASDRIIYDNQTGALSFDMDGAGGGSAIQFATLTAQLNLSAADFLIV